MLRLAADAFVGDSRPQNRLHPHPSRHLYASGAFGKEGSKVQLEEYLTQNRVAYQTMSHAPVYTSQALAAADHVSGHCVAKPVLVRGGGGFTLCVLPASAHLNVTRVGQILQDEHLRLATEAELATVCPDCELGAEPPIGTMFGLKTLMDESLHDEEFLVFQAGSHTRSVKVRREDYERLANPTVDAIAYH
jgi:Ala-tRNA(Pro) deacylase